MLTVKVFFNKDCVEFQNLVKHNRSLLEKIQLSEKYNLLFKKYRTLIFPA
jgi:predicted thioredoxin/glutaredoxin